MRALKPATLAVVVLVEPPLLHTPQPHSPSDPWRGIDPLGRRRRPMRAMVAAEQSGHRPELALLPINGAVLCDYDGLDPAGRWCDCNRPDCPHAAFLVDLYPTVEAARRDARPRAELFADLNVRSHRERLMRSYHLYVRRLSSTEVRGHDYRGAGCRIANAAEQLRDGRGIEPAWLEIKRQRLQEGADGALLDSSRTPGGLLFVYASALDRLRLSDVIEELTYPF